MGTNCTIPGVERIVLDDDSRQQWREGMILRLKITAGLRGWDRERTERLIDWFSEQPTPETLRELPGKDEIIKQFEMQSR